MITKISPKEKIYSFVVHAVNLYSVSANYIFMFKKIFRCKEYRQSMLIFEYKWIKSPLFEKKK